MDVTKPFEFIGSGAMDVTKPYEFIRSGAMDVTKPYEFIGLGATYRFRCEPDPRPLGGPTRPHGKWSELGMLGSKREQPRESGRISAC
jgi:hypothetical protein